MNPEGQTDRVSTFKIFVKNLPSGITEEELRAIFEEFGRVVECRVFRNTFAFVHMEQEANGTSAITMLNGRSLRGSIINVEESSQKDQGPSIPSTRLRVRNIPLSLNADGLRNLFTKYGLVLAAEITNREGIVSIEATGDLRTALAEVNGFVYDGETLSVEPLVNTSATYSPKTKPQKFTPKFSQQPRPLPLLPSPGHAGPPDFQQSYQNDDYYPPQQSNYYDNQGPPPPEEDYGYPGNDRVARNPRFIGNGNPQANWNRPPPPSYPDPSPEGRVLRDPYGPGLRPLMSMRQPMMRPLMGRPPFRPSMQNSFRPPAARPLFRGHPGPRGRPPPRPLMMNRPPQMFNTNIEPLFHRRHELLNSGPRPPIPNNNNQPFYEDEPLEPPHRAPPAYGANGSGFNNGNSGGPLPLMAHPQPPPPLMAQCNNPPPLMRPNFGRGMPVKRRVPEAAPGQPFEVPPMIPPGTFQPPKKYFENRQRPAGQKKKKKRVDPADQPPIPEEYHRPVPDFSDYYSQPLPEGSVLKPFPPPLMNTDFSNDEDLY